MTADPQTTAGTRRLQGTVALITGASSGIGAAVARSLAELGADVSLVARRGDRLTALAEQLQALGVRVHVEVADITDREQAEASVQHTVEALGHLDILVNNAGVMLVGHIETAPVEEWERMIALNLQALLYMTHAGIPHLLTAAATHPRGAADLINISSTAGLTTRPSMGVYSATKWGVGTFSEVLRQEITARNVRVGLVEPGSVATELTSHMRPEALAEVRSNMPTGMGSLDAQDVADAVAYIVTRRGPVMINELVIRPTSASI